MALPVEVRGLVRVVGKTVKTPLMRVPGIPGAVLYTTGDAFGAKFIIDSVVDKDGRTQPLPSSGIIHFAKFVDRDDEGVETDLVLFTGDFAATADGTSSVSFA